MLLVIAVSPALGADFSSEQVHEILAAATSDKPPDLSGRSLENLDLSNFAFKRANLSRANLFGAKLNSADFSGANLFVEVAQFAVDGPPRLNRLRPQAGSDQTLPPA